jgi:hypothetical protein
MLLSPLAFGAARVWLVNAKARGGAERLRAQDQSARQQAMIEQLAISRWPMTKLLADVSASVPQGITVESLRIATDQGVQIQGTAESAELVSTMQSNLNATKLLSNLRPNRIESTGSSVEFDISADVVNPYFPAKPADDWSTRTLAVRLYGEGASNTSTPSGTGRARRGGDSGASVREPGGRRVRDRGGDSENGDRRGREARAERPAEAAPPPKLAPGEAPPALTDEQIRAMTADAAKSEMVKRRLAAGRAADSPTRTRLNAEADRLREHANASRAAAPAPGSGAPTGATGASGGKP